MNLKTRTRRGGLRRSSGAVLAAGLLPFFSTGSVFGDPLQMLMDSAWRENPRVAAARAEVARARFEADAVNGFFDPLASVRAGVSDVSRDFYGLTSHSAFLDDISGMQAGIESALRPGLYLGVGGERWRRTDGAAKDRDVSRAGARLRIPLLKDRGFFSWRARNSSAAASVEAARAHLLDVTQRVELDVETRSIELQTAYAQLHVAQSATARAERLFEETRQMAELHAVPAFQVHPARLEIARRREEQAAAEQVVRSARRRLEELVGNAPAEAFEPVDFMAWGSRLEIPPESAGSPAPDRRGDYLAQVWTVTAETARLAEARDALRQDLTLEAGYSWTEDALESGDPRHGADLTLVWRRPLGNREARATARAREAQMQSSSDILRALEREIATERDVAGEEFRSAAGRLNWMTEAVDAARAAVDAEEERFRLGEGASRQALDAQKDLTDILKRRNEVVADTLKAQARFRFATGESGDAARQRQGTDP